MMWPGDNNLNMKCSHHCGHWLVLMTVRRRDIRGDSGPAESYRSLLSYTNAFGKASHCTSGVQLIPMKVQGSKRHLPQGQHKAIKCAGLLGHVLPGRTMRGVLLFYPFYRWGI